MSLRFVIDTNVVLRILLADHPVHSPAARAWVDRAVRRRDVELIILSAVLTEIVQVLRSPPESRSHAQILSALDTILALPVEIENRQVVEVALDLFRGLHSRDWEDCLIAAHAITQAGGNLVTYDQSLSFLPGVVAVQP